MKKQEIETIRTLAEDACKKSEATQEMVLVIKASMDTKIDRLNASIENLRDNHIHTLSNDVQKFKVFVTSQFGDLKEHIAVQLGDVKGSIKKNEVKTGLNKDLLWLILSQIVIGAVVIGIVKELF